MSSLVELHRRLSLHGAENFRERLLELILIPVGWLYGSIGLVRERLYRWAILRSFQASVPVVSVGNLSAGGTGKTPMVDYVVKALAGLGVRTAVVSRGYGGSGVPGVGVVSAGDGREPLLDAAICGDEPYLLARRNPGAVVLIAPRRSAGVRRAVDEFQTQVVVLDDGFQHMAVQRDLDVVLLDSRTLLGNRRPLPAGMLREFPSALRRGDLFILTRWHEGCPDPPSLPGPALRCRHRIGSQAMDLQGTAMPLSALKGKRIAAFAGIADPDGFFRALAEKGLEPVATLPLEDHAVYDQATLKRLRGFCKDADILITTEKDGVKLAGVELPLPCYQLPVAIEFLKPGELEAALSSILVRRPRNNNSRRSN